MNKIVCPHCFETFERSEVMFRCTNPRCKQTEDAVQTRFYGGTTPRLNFPAFQGKGGFGSIFGKMPEYGVCPECGDKSYTVICPYCHNRVPKQMVKNKGYIISIIGARSSGKTNYITTLINELMHNGQNLGNIGTVASAASDRPEDNTQQRYINKFYNVMYRNKELPAGTSISDDNKIPLIYELGQKGKTPIYLVFYDTAGENFNDYNKIAENVSYIKHSDAILFVLDTFCIPYVNEKFSQAGIKLQMENPFDMIVSNLMAYFNDQVDEPTRKEHQKKPMALTFSKIDTILNNEQIFENCSIPGMSLMRNSSFLDGSGVNLDDINSMSEGLRAALEAWGESNFVNSIERFYSNVKYFGISALGGMPENGKIVNLRPYRVLDPLVWILHEFNYSLPITKS